MARTLVRSIDFSKTPKNVVINGAFDFWQRSISSTANSYGYVAPDRFLAGANIATSTVERSTDVPSELINIVDYSMRVSPEATQTVDSTSFGVIDHWVEGNFSKELYNGEVILSFYFKSNKLGTYSIGLRDKDVNIDSYVSEFTVSDTNWNRYSFTIDLSLASNLGIDSGRGLLFTINLMKGTNYETSTFDTWGIGGNKFVSSNQVNFFDNISNECFLTGVMLHEASFGEIPFQRAGRDYTEELKLCQRYFEKSFSVNTTPTGGLGEWGISQEIEGNVPNGQIANANVQFKIEKRISPTINLYPGEVAGAVGTIYVNGSALTANPDRVTTTNFQRVSNTSGLTWSSPGVLIFHWTANAEL